MLQELLARPLQATSLLSSKMGQPTSALAPRMLPRSHQARQKKLRNQKAKFACQIRNKALPKSKTQSQTASKRSLVVLAGLRLCATFRALCEIFVHEKGHPLFCHLVKYFSALFELNSQMRTNQNHISAINPSQVDL